MWLINSDVLTAPMQVDQNQSSNASECNFDFKINAIINTCPVFLVFHSIIKIIWVEMHG